MTTRPVINITHAEPGKRPRKFARVVFPEGWTLAAIRDTLARFPETQGYRCDLREVGPQGFSLPWTGTPLNVAGGL